MCTVRSSRLALAVLIVGAWFSQAVDAHPVAQGAMDISVTDRSLRIQATVSSEEVLVAATGAPPGSGNAWTAYGEYLKSHLHIRADSENLSGRVISVAQEARARPVYVLEYPFAEPPARIRIAQDALHELEYAPGNNWEAAYLVTVRRGDTAPPSEHLLTLTQPIEIGIAAPRDGSLAFGFFLHGMRHILGGFDHLLFIGALVLAATGLWDLIKVVSAFTLAHTITLTLATLDIFRLPPAFVEPAIAASIIVVALLNLRGWRSQPGSHRHGTGTWARASVAFFFGLFHGLGFAGGLLDAAAGMPAGQLAMALGSFSVGVEAGQQVVVIPVFVALTLIRKAGTNAAHSAALLQRGGAVAISLGGLAYLVATLRY